VRSTRSMRSMWRSTWSHGAHEEHAEEYIEEHGEKPCMRSLKLRLRSEMGMRIED